MKNVYNNNKGTNKVLYVNNKGSKQHQQTERTTTSSFWPSFSRNLL